MAEYIEREALLKELRKSRESHAETSKDFCLLIRCENIVREQLAADVAPVRHGHWIDCEDEYSSYVRCSECGDEYTNWEADCAHTDFCPGCGADMRGADNGQAAD